MAEQEEEQGEDHLLSPNVCVHLRNFLEYKCEEMQEIRVVLMAEQTDRMITHIMKILIRVSKLYLPVLGELLDVDPRFFIPAYEGFRWYFPKKYPNSVILDKDQEVPDIPLDVFFGITEDRLLESVHRNLNWYFCGTPYFNTSELSSTVIKEVFHHVNAAVCRIMPSLSISQRFLPLLSSYFSSSCMTAADDMITAVTAKLTSMIRAQFTQLQDSSPEFRDTNVTLSTATKERMLAAIKASKASQLQELRSETAGQSTQVQNSRIPARTSSIAWSMARGIMVASVKIMGGCIDEEEPQPSTSAIHQQIQDSGQSDYKSSMSCSLGELWTNLDEDEEDEKDLGPFAKHAIRIYQSDELGLSKYVALWKDKPFEPNKAIIYFAISRVLLEIRHQLILSRERTSVEAEFTHYVTELMLKKMEYNTDFAFEFLRLLDDHYKSFFNIKDGCEPSSAVLLQTNCWMAALGEINSLADLCVVSERLDDLVSDSRELREEFPKMIPLVFKGESFVFECFYKNGTPLQDKIYCYQYKTFHYLMALLTNIGEKLMRSCILPPPASATPRIIPSKVIPFNETAEGHLVTSIPSFSVAALRHCVRTVLFKMKERSMVCGSPLTQVTNEWVEEITNTAKISMTLFTDVTIEDGEHSLGVLPASIIDDVFAKLLLRICSENGLIDADRIKRPIFLAGSLAASFHETVLSVDPKDFYCHTAPDENLLVPSSDLLDREDYSTNFHLILLALNKDLYHKHPSFEKALKSALRKYQDAETSNASAAVLTERGSSTTKRCQSNLSRFKRLKLNLFKKKAKKESNGKSVPVDLVNLQSGSTADPGMAGSETSQQEKFR